MKSTILSTLGVFMVIVSSQTVWAGNHAQSLHIKFTLTGQVTPTADQCVALVLETGTATSNQLGDFTWSSQGVDNFCSRGQGKGSHVALSTFTAKNGDKIYAQLQTPFVSDGVSVVWTGTWEFVGGTGKFAGIRGRGTIPTGTIPNVRDAATVSYDCEFDGTYSN